MDLTSLTTAAKLLVNANADVDVRTDLKFQRTLLMQVAKKIWAAIQPYLRMFVEKPVSTIIHEVDSMIHVWCLWE